MKYTDKSASLFEFIIDSKIEIHIIWHFSISSNISSTDPYSEYIQMSSFHNFVTEIPNVSFDFIWLAMFKILDILEVRQTDIASIMFATYNKKFISKATPITNWGYVSPLSWKFELILIRPFNSKEHLLYIAISCIIY